MCKDVCCCVGFTATMYMCVKLFSTLVCMSIGHIRTVCIHPAVASQCNLGMLAGCSSMSKSKASTMRQRYDLSLPVRVGRTSINVAGRNNCGFKPRDCSNSSLAFRTSSLSSGGAIGHFTISTSLMLLVCVNPIRYTSACQQWTLHVFFLGAASCC